MLSYWVPVIFLLASIISWVGAVLWLDKYSVKNISDQEKCIGPDAQNKYCGQDKNCCLIWDNGTCVKGKSDGNGVCVGGGHVGPLILAIIGIILFITFIVTLVMAIKSH